MKKRIYRSTTDKYIAGVAGGLADQFSLDPTLVRVAFAVLAVASGLGIVAYIALAIVAPTKEELEMKERIQKETESSDDSYNPFD